MITRRTALGLLAASVALPRPALAAPEPPLFEADVASGALPPMADRLPRNPRVIAAGGDGAQDRHAWRVDPHPDRRAARYPADADQRLFAAGGL